nr:hepatoma-derived growth factor-related protein 2-like [Aegilops tauschii subsp. strangulata]
MSEGSDGQNRSEEQVNLSDGTSPSDNSYDDGSRSTPGNLPKAATRQRKNRTSESEDEDFVIEEKVTSKKKVLKKEYATAATKPGMQKKAPAKRNPMFKARASTQETMEFTLEPREEEAAGGKKRKERVKKTMARVIGKPSMMRGSDEDEEEEEPAAPPPKTQKLMGDAIRTGAAPSKPKSIPKPPTQAQASKSTAPKRSTRNISATEKNKAPMPEAQEDEELQMLRKLKPKIPDHSDDHPVAQNMKERKDVGLRLWRQTDPYATRRRTAVDYRFHTKEQQGFMTQSC